MKKLFLFFILISGFVFGQDINFAQSLNNITPNQIQNVSDEIVSEYRGNLRFLRSIENKDGEKIMIYYSSEISDNDIKEDSKTDYCSLCTEVKFKKYYKGRDNDLEIKGTETYKFVSIEGKYLDLYKWWIKHFSPSETKESLVNSDKRYFKSSNPNINIRFTKTLDVWEISNIY